MPRSNKNALGKPQGVKKQKVVKVVAPEPTQYKRVVIPMSIGSRLDDAVIQRLYGAVR